MQMTCNKISLALVQKPLTFLCIFLTVFGMSSCERAATENEDENKVSWPEITHFDDLAFRADGLVRVKDLSAARALLSELVQSGLASKHPPSLTTFPLLRKSN